MKLIPLMPLVLLAICALHSSFGFAQRFSVTIEVPEVVLLGCEFSEDGSLFATGGDCIRVFHTDSGTPVQHFRPSIRPRKTDPIEFSFDDHIDVGKFIDFDAYKFYSRAFAFSPVARGVIAAGCDDGSLVIWNATTLQKLPLEGHRGAVGEIAFSPDGVLLASVGQRRHHTGKILGELRLWNTQTGELIRSEHFYNSGTACIAFSHDGRLLAFSGNSNSRTSESRIEVYEVSSWKRHNSIEILEGHAYSLLFQHDDRSLIVCGGECIPLGQNSCRPTGRIWLCATSSTSAALPVKDESQFGYFKYARLLADSKQFLVRTEVTQKNRVVGQLQVRDATTGAVISSFDSEAGSDIHRLAVHPRTGQILMCRAESIELLDTNDSAGTQVFSRTVSNEAW